MRLEALLLYLFFNADAPAVPVKSRDLYGNLNIGGEVGKEEHFTKGKQKLADTGGVITHNTMAENKEESDYYTVLPDDKKAMNWHHLIHKYSIRESYYEIIKKRMSSLEVNENSNTMND